MNIFHQILLIQIIKLGPKKRNLMLSTFTKKIIGIQKNIKPYLHKDKSGVQRLIIYKGYEPHFQWFQNNQSYFSERNRIYCYDRCTVDIALQMALRNTFKLSYISTRNYQTVEAINRNKNKQSNLEFSQKSKKPDKLQKMLTKEAGEKIRIDNTISLRAKDIIKNYDFSIKNTYLDIHPLQAYERLCGYLMITKNQTILNQFQGFRCTEANLFKSFLILPLLEQLRNKYLVVDELKLKNLERKSNEKISQQKINFILQKWVQIVQIKSFQNAVNSFEQKQKVDWVISNNLGQQITKKDILNQQYRRYFYATWN